MADEKKPKADVSPRTRAVHGAFSTSAWDFSKHLMPPMTASTTFRLESLKRGAQGFIEFGGGKESPEPTILIYDRLDEPNTMLLEEQMAVLESSECAVSFGSGMGAITASLLATMQSGQRVLAHPTVYGCTFSLMTQWLPRMGIETLFHNLNEADLNAVLSDSSVRVVYFESLSNPSLELIDFPRVAAAVEKANAGRSDDDKILILVDNTFATPWGMRPLEWGADFVIQSLTKNISGFGTEMGGAVMTSKKYEKLLKVARKDFGAIMTPHSAWHILVYGLPTQALRFEKQQENAQKVAEFLLEHPKVETVVYPGLENYPQRELAQKLLVTPEGQFAPGTMISFKLRGGMAECESFVDDVAKNSYSITLAVSLGLTKTLIEVPGYMTHSAIPEALRGAARIDPTMIRLSLGIENAEDIITDLSASLAKL